MIIRAMRPEEVGAVAEVVWASTNAWYKANRGFDVFTGGVESCRLFPDTYEAIDPGCCVVAEDSEQRGRLMGSCFYHPRETHVALGIMNVHPAYFGRGVASHLLRDVIGIAAVQRKPVRLVSSAMNLDSFSLYSRAGFVPRAVFADMMVPPERVAGIECAELHRVRPATTMDVPFIVQLEASVSGIRRELDWRFFIENRQGIWHTFVFEGANGAIEGVLGSVHHPGSHMVGPGVMRHAGAAAALVAAQLKHHAGRSPVFLVPLKEAELVRTLYEWGAKNVELHFLQVLGSSQELNGVMMPTFMPETG
jgi:GNAT superfamily N-acetyltransferase